MCLLNTYEPFSPGNVFNKQVFRLTFAVPSLVPKGEIFSCELTKTNGVHRKPNQRLIYKLPINYSYWIQVPTANTVKEETLIAKGWLY